MHVYELRPGKDKCGVDLVSDVLPFRCLWYGELNATSYAERYSRSHEAVIHVYDAAGNVIARHEHNAFSRTGQFLLVLERSFP